MGGKTRPGGLTRVQIRVLESLWRLDSATVSQVHEEMLADSSLARNTVATLLTRLERYGFVERRKQGREFAYSPLLSRAEVRAEKVADLTASVFRDDVPSLVSHALEAGDLADGDLERIRELLAQHDKTND